MTKVKVCCIKSLEEANLALSSGADYIGLVGPMPSGPGTLTINQIKEIKNSLSPSVKCFFLTSKTTASTIEQEYDELRTSHIQLTDYVEPSVHHFLKSKYPEVSIVQVVHVIDSSSIELARSYAQSSDYLLLDSGSPNNKVKTLGGTGKKHNWEISKQIVQSIDIPVFLAGGINPANVNEALSQVNPFGIDLCSGLRTSDRLDETKIKQFFKLIDR